MENNLDSVWCEGQIRTSVVTGSGVRAKAGIYATGTALGSPEVGPGGQGAWGGGCACWAVRASQDAGP